MRVRSRWGSAEVNQNQNHSWWLAGLLACCFRLLPLRVVMQHAACWDFGLGYWILLLVLDLDLAIAITCSSKIKIAISSPCFYVHIQL